MPDPAGQTISASQAPALWNASPWLTRWMLYKNFADGMPIDSEEDARMKWGKLLEPVILKEAASELAMEITPHDQTYVRSGQLGATRDADVVAPDLGPGTVEVKCVFDYRTWMSDWSGGAQPPRHVEIQTAQQMLVGDGTTSFKWGIIIAWVAGELHYFRREPIPTLWEALQKEAAAFFEQVAQHDEPDPFGSQVEMPFLSAMERAPGKLVDLQSVPGADDLATAARLLYAANAQVATAEKAKKAYKAKLFAAIGDAETALLAGDIKIDLKTVKRAEFTVEPTQFTTMKIHVPGEGA
jgi:predicted phage-related endonuclease